MWENFVGKQLLRPKVNPARGYSVAQPPEADKKSVNGVQLIIDL